MATEAQINANRENAAHSTGAYSPEGHYASSRNPISNGLYTHADFVLPDEHEIYHFFVTNMQNSFEAVDCIEEHLAAEVTSAAWRMRRCNLVDGEIAAPCMIDPLLDLNQEKRIRSVERARAHSTSIFHRSLNQIRKLQKERKSQEKPVPMVPTQQQKEKQFLDNLGSQINSIMHCEEPDWDEIDRQIAENRAKEAELGTSENTLVPFWNQSLAEAPLRRHLGGEAGGAGTLSLMPSFPSLCT